MITLQEAGAIGQGEALLTEVSSGRARDGVGSKLHTNLLTGIAAKRTTLTARPEVPAAARYEHLGYTPSGHTRPWDGAPV
ncbi:hypothetical protein ACFXPW_08655 [Streptomyces goshikiensis]|uniref:hypothetical protein n=1 Tax=Streptomyces goshikiensis TaxID=1942 RepID=UPI0036AC45D0